MKMVCVDPPNHNHNQEQAQRKRVESDTIVSESILGARSKTKRKRRRDVAYLLVENRLLLSTETGLLTVVPPLACSAKNNPRGERPMCDVTQLV